MRQYLLVRCKSLRVLVTVRHAFCESSFGPTTSSRNPGKISARRNACHDTTILCSRNIAIPALPKVQRVPLQFSCCAVLRLVAFFESPAFWTHLKCPPSMLRCFSTVTFASSMDSYYTRQNPTFGPWNRPVCFLRSAKQDVRKERHSRHRRMPGKHIRLSPPSHPSILQSAYQEWSRL